MLPFVIVPFMLTLASGAKTIHQRSIFSSHFSAASPAQIRFAEENKYDNTGPGAKKPEYAYNTYKNIEDALLGYLDDPDTKLPENEREKVIRKYAFKPFFKDFTGDVKSKYSLRPRSKLLDFNEVDGRKNREVSEAVRSKVFGRPVTFPRYESRRDFDEPSYSFSYGVHDKQTGDSKSAHESREGGTVRGFYTFMDADGKQRTVHYTANDKEGFKATVERTQTNHQ